MLVGKQRDEALLGSRRGKQMVMAAGASPCGMHGRQAQRAWTERRGGAGNQDKDTAASDTETDCSHGCPSGHLGASRPNEQAQGVRVSACVLFSFEKKTNSIPIGCW